MYLTLVTSSSGHLGSDAPASLRGTPRVESTSLFRGDRELVIVHRGQEYRLRITRADKLILTK